MTQYIAYNTGMSATTAMTAGQTFNTSVVVVGLQLGIPAGGTILVKEFGWTQSTTTATSTLLELSSTATASTMGTAHSTTTVKPVDTNNVNAGASRLTMSTTATGFQTVGTTNITSRTALRNGAKLYVPQTYVYQFALGDEMEFGAAAAEFVQLTVTPSATITALCWIKWIERI